MPKPKKQLFNVKTASAVVKLLKTKLNYPFINAYVSTLGGPERVSVLLTVSTSIKSEWPNGILENSRYAKIHITNNGTVEQFSGMKLKLRKFIAKDYPHMIQRINAMKRV